MQEKPPDWPQTELKAEEKNTKWLDDWQKKRKAKQNKEREPERQEEGHTHTHTNKT